MVKLVVLYGPPTDPTAFEDHYANTHAPLALAVPGLKRFESGPVVGTPDDSAPPFQRIAELWFDSQEDLEAGLGSSEGQAAVNDIPNFATGGATVVVVAIDA